MTRTKSDNILAVTQTGLTRKQSSRAVNTMLEIIKHTLVQGDDLVIRGFGQFRVYERKGSAVPRKPMPNCMVPPEARRIVIFRCSPTLKGKINHD
jgi:integration host factor subunit alpha